jgi:hypothetical protein
MQTKTTFKLLGATLISLILTGCGGGDGSALDNTLNGGGTVTSSSSSSAENEDTLQSLEFKDAIPAIINLKGTGGAESALVRFRTLGQTGKPIAKIAVNFTLTSVVGGLGLSQTSGISDKDGYVSTSVNSGNISTSIRVTATVKDKPEVTTVSSELVIATGLPDQKSMSIALEKFNPAGWNYINVTSKVTVLLADAYNNPAPDGTTVYFTTEGGSIKPNCTTVGGGCEVLWTSQDPRPPRRSSDDSINRILCLGPFTAPDSLSTCEAERAGRSTILATAVGNESFKDTNGNGVYDPDVDIFRTSKGKKCMFNVPVSSFESSTEAEACDDLAEAYLDINENGLHESDPNPEHFINFITATENDVGTDNYTPNNGLYNGAFCQEKDESAVPSKCSRAPVTIRKQHMIVMSCDHPLLDSDGLLPKLPGTPQTPNFNFYAVADCNGNSLPVGSTITVGLAAPITIVNQYDWTLISAAPGTSVKLTIAAGGGTKEIIVTGN